MNLNDYSSNSRKSKLNDKPITNAGNTGDKKITPVVQSKKTGYLSGLASSTISEVGYFLKNEVIMPTLKDLIFGVVSRGADVWLNGQPTRTKNDGYGYRNNYTESSYRPYYDDRVRYGSTNDRFRDDRSSRNSRFSRFSHIENVNLTYADCLKLQDSLIDIFDVYGSVSIADLCDSAGAEHEYTDCKYGWNHRDDIRAARPFRKPNGYYSLDLPSPEPIRN